MEQLGRPALDPAAYSGPDTAADGSAPGAGGVLVREEAVDERFGRGEDVYGAEVASTLNSICWNHVLGIGVHGHIVAFMSDKRGDCIGRFGTTIGLCWKATCSMFTYFQSSSYFVCMKQQNFTVLL